MYDNCCLGIPLSLSLPLNGIIAFHNTILCSFSLLYLSILSIYCLSVYLYLIYLWGIISHVTIFFFCFFFSFFLFLSHSPSLSPRNYLPLSDVLSSLTLISSLSISLFSLISPPILYIPFSLLSLSISLSICSHTKTLFSLFPLPLSVYLFAILSCTMIIYSLIPLLLICLSLHYHLPHYPIPSLFPLPLSAYPFVIIISLSKTLNLFFLSLYLSILSLSSSPSVKHSIPFSSFSICLSLRYHLLPQ